MLGGGKKKKKGLHQKMTIASLCLEHVLRNHRARTQPESGWGEFSIGEGYVEEAASALSS